MEKSIKFLPENIEAKLLEIGGWVLGSSLGLDSGPEASKSHLTTTWISRGLE